MRGKPSQKLTSPYFFANEFSINRKAYANDQHFIKIFSCERSCRRSCYWNSGCFQILSVGQDHGHQRYTGWLFEQTCCCRLGFSPGLCQRNGGLWRCDGGNRDSISSDFVGVLLPNLIIKCQAAHFPATEKMTEIGFARLIVSGALVGFGTQLGNGCTSGHGAFISLQFPSHSEFLLGVIQLYRYMRNCPPQSSFPAGNTHFHGLGKRRCHSVRHCCAHCPTRTRASASRRCRRGPYRRIRRRVAGRGTRRDACRGCVSAAGAAVWRSVCGGARGVGHGQALQGAHDARAAQHIARK